MKKELTYRADYDIKIDYLGIPALDKRKLENDTLVVIFDGNFDQDTVSVFINGSPLKNMILKTDEKIGLAGDIKTIKHKDVDNLGFRINDGKLVYVEPVERHYNIRLTYLDSVVTIRFYRKLPAYF